MTPGLTEYGALSSVLMKHVRDAFVSDAVIAVQWKALNFSEPPDIGRAIDEYEAFLEILRATGADILFLPSDPSTTLDSVYTRDAAIVVPDGVAVCNMGKPLRAAEPGLQQDELSRRGWPIAGAIAAPGRLEGGDVIWLDEGTVVVGQGKRTNAEGIGQLKTLLKERVEEIVVVPLPDYPSQHDVMHLMSLISPIDIDMAVVYRPLLPDAVRRMLLDRGYQFVEVPDAEFDTMGANVLALGPRECVMLDGNPKTRAALERAGARVSGVRRAGDQLERGRRPDVPHQTPDAWMSWGIGRLVDW